MGHEAGPSALRAAGIIDRIQSIGYEVIDFGDDSVQVSDSDKESPRARNLAAVIAALEALKPRIEQAVKSGALALILAGDCSVALATVAAARRYYRNVGLVYMDRDADLHTPATTVSGSVDGMVVSHLTGRGAAELVRLWGEPPLVREPDLALFGVDRLDPAEQEVLNRSPLRCYLAVDIHRMGAIEAAQLAIKRMQGLRSSFVLHLDVDVISDFPYTNYPGSGGLSVAEVGEVLRIFAKQDSLAAIEVTAYNPATDFDRLGAKTIIELVADALHSRIASGPEVAQTEPGSIGNADFSQNSDPSLVSALETERVERPLGPSSLVNGADETSS